MIHAARITSRLFRCSIAALLLSTLALPAQPDPPAPTFANVTVHDPSVIRDGSSYYVFGSHLASASTTDLINWTQITRDWDAVTNPTCVLIQGSSPQTQFAAALAYTQPPAFWAPDVEKLGDGRFYFYYCVCNGTSKAALGLAVANSILGPYSNVRIMIESGTTPSQEGTTYNNAIHPNAVDPTVFYDQTGRLWMVYGSYSGGIFILQLDSTVGSPTFGQPLLAQSYGKKLIGGNNCTIEGTYIFYSPETAYYYMFFTYGGLDSTGGYNIRMGRSLNPDGPYLDAAGNDLTNVHGAPGTVFDNTSIAPYAVKLMGNWQFLHAAGEPLTTSRGYVSPGGCSINRDAATGRYFLVFHTRFVGQGEYHEVRVHQMYLNVDGWFVIAPQRYAGETISPTVPSQIPGVFKLINHGKDITATVKTSTLITLNADGSITGASTGTWLLSGEHYATLTLDGTTYRGVFSRQWDDDNQVWVVTFSALSTNGVAVWGSKAAIAAPPAIITQPANQTVTIGDNANFTVAASGTPAPTYQWKKDGTTMAGATNALLSLNHAQASDAGSYTVVVSNNSGSITSSAAVLTVYPSNGNALLSAISCRAVVGTGGNVLIPGIIINGSGPKQVIVRASGPALISQGVDGVLAQPQLRLYSGQTVIAENTGWSSGTAANTSALQAAVTQAGLTPFAAGSADCALLATLTPGAYTAIISGANNTTGVALVEVYELGASSSRLSAISCRAVVGTGGNVLIPGIIVGGSGPKRVILRASGPALIPQGVDGVLARPQLRLYSGQTVIAENIGWSSGTAADTSALQAAFTQVSLSSFPAGSADCALLATLMPGAYTAVISGVNDTTGVALIEVYETP